LVVPCPSPLCKGSGCGTNSRPTCHNLRLSVASHAWTLEHGIATNARYTSNLVLGAFGSAKIIRGFIPNFARGQCWTIGLLGSPFSAIVCARARIPVRAEYVHPTCVGPTQKMLGLHKMKSEMVTNKKFANRRNNSGSTLLSKKKKHIQLPCMCQTVGHDDEVILRIIFPQNFHETSLVQFETLDHI